MGHIWNSIALASGLLMVPALGGAQTVDVNDAVSRWLQTRAQPIARVAPGPDQSDLQFLKQVFGRAQVVGLGEATHGTREFFLVKRRLVQFLVTELGFTTLAMEASASDIEPLNDYVLHGTGDLAAALTAQGYIAWDTEEMTSLMAWLRAYNARVSAERKVQVVGLDVLMNSRGRARVLEYLRAHAPTRVADTEALFKVLAEEEANIGSTKLRRERVAASLQRLESVQGFLLNQQALPGTADGKVQLESVKRDVQRMIQRALSAGPQDSAERLDRSEAMGRNALEVLKTDSRTKAIVWAHNVHLAIGYADGRDNMGALLRQALGDAYYGIGFEFGSGRVQVRPPSVEGAGGPLGELEVSPAPARSLPWYLGQTQSADVFVDLRAPRPPLVSDWLAQPIETHYIWWAHKADQATTVREPVGRYDGLVFIRVSSPSRPTKNAVAKAARGEAF